MTDVAARSYLPTPLHARTAELCATNAWTEECGFTVPAVYGSLREEQDALGARVALSDLSARQCWAIEGPDAAAFLSFATIGDVTRLEPGQTARTLWCDDAGFVRGDGLIAHFGKMQFELSSAVRDFAWLLDGAQGFDVKITNATGARAVIGVRGPLAPNLLAAAGLSTEATGTGLTHPSWRPAQVALMRDAAGEGFELSMQADDGVVVWDRLWRSGAALGVAAAGVQALEALRIENGAPRAGVDWQPAHLARDPSVLRVPTDLGFTPDLTRRFNGAEALRRARPASRQILVQFSADEPLAPGPLSMRSATVGRLTSQAWSETRASANALGWLDIDAVKIGTKVSAPGLAGPVRAEIIRQVFAETA